MSIPDFSDIPGTRVMTGRHSQKGYHLNMFCMSLNKAANREAFRKDEAAYLDKYPLTPEQREAILERQWLRMLDLGGNIYYTYKLVSYDRRSMQYVGAQMSGISEEEFRAMMVAKGRNVDGNRSIKEGNDDLTAIDGIDAVIEKRLKAVGVCTYRTLANTSLERLQAIMNLAGMDADPSNWAEQAATLKKS